MLFRTATRTRISWYFTREVQCEMEKNKIVSINVGFRYLLKTFYADKTLFGVIEYLLTKVNS